MTNTPSLSQSDKKTHGDISILPDGHLSRSIAQSRQVRMLPEVWELLKKLELMTA